MIKVNGPRTEMEGDLHEILAEMSCACSALMMVMVSEFGEEEALEMLGTAIAKGLANGTAKAKESKKEEKDNG